MYPLKMSPCIKEIIWGGNKMKEYYNKEYAFDKAGESWEVSSNRSGESSVAQGKFKGLSMSELLSKHPEITGNGNLPLMFKIIDANSDLSIQVHPEDDYAKINENSPHGKTEMWYIISADKGSHIGYGFNCPMTDEKIKKAVEEGNLEKYINYIDVEAGDTFFIPAGTVHCLCSGLLVAELQQNSDVTYRLYDYNRTDAFGKKRELHLDKALDVINYECDLKGAVKPEKKEVQRTVSCEYFSCDMINCKEEYKDKADGKYHILFFEKGEGCIEYNDGSEKFTSGDTFLIPASLGDYSVKGNCRYMKGFE